MIYDVAGPLKDDAASIKHQYSKEQNFVSDLSKLKDIKKELAVVSGSWLR